MARKLNRAEKAKAVAEAWMEAETPNAFELVYDYNGCGCLAWEKWECVEEDGMSDAEFAKHMQVESMWQNHEIEVRAIEELQQEVDRYNYEESWFEDNSWEVDEWDFEFEGAFPRLVRSSTPDYVDEFRRKKVLEELAWIFGEFDMNAE
jgi:hypothetical protein